MQKLLSHDQIQAFFHDDFVQDQVRDFIKLFGYPSEIQEVVADVGGGCGMFAEALASYSDWRPLVLDQDPTCIEACHAKGIPARLADALDPGIQNGESAAAFNLVLHHLIGADERETRRMQVQALRAWVGSAHRVFVHEYVYESFLFPGFSAWAIWQITRSALLSRMGRLASRVAPALRANTFGVGVRFRTSAAWQELFREAGYEIAGKLCSREDAVPPARRLLLIRSCRRESYLLKPCDVRAA